MKPAFHTIYVCKAQPAWKDSTKTRFPDIWRRLQKWFVLTDDNHGVKASLISSLFLVGQLSQQMQ